MTRILLALFTLCAAAAPAAAIDRRYSVTDFDRLVVEGPYVVRLTTGASSSATASGTQAALDRATIEVSGQTLRIRRNRTYWGGNPGAQQGPLTIELRTRNLRSARLIGPARLEVDGLRGLRVDLTVEGSGELRASNVAADNLSLGLAGAGRIVIAGTAERLTADFQGTGDVDGSALRVENANVTTTTTGTVTLGVEEEASITALGLGEVIVLGRPACTLRGANADLVRCGPTAQSRR
jgi:hypothetical protein